MVMFAIVAVVVIAAYGAVLVNKHVVSPWLDKVAGEIR